VRAIIGLAISLILGALGSVQASADEIDNILDELVSKDQLSSRYDDLYRDYPIKHERPYCINRKAKPAEDCIRLIIVRHTAIAERSHANSSSAFQNLELNAKTFGEKAILVDDLYLDVIIVNAINHKKLLFSRMPGNEEKFETVFVLGTLQLLANFRRTLGNDPELVGFGWKSIPELANEILRQEKEGNDSEAFASTVTSLVLEHEYAHLERSASWYERVMLNASSIFGSSTLLAEERRADAVGLQRSYSAIVDYLKQQPTDAELDSAYGQLRRAGGEPKDVWGMLAATHMLSVAHANADLALYNAFRDPKTLRFRSFNLNEVLITMTFSPCTRERENGLTKIGTPSEIERAYYRALPILTEQEFSTVSRRVQLVGKTHDHDVVRAENIYSFVREPERDRLGFFRKLGLEEQVAYVRSLLDGNPKMLHSTYRGGLEATIKGANLQNLLNTLREYGRVESAVTCPKGACFVAFLEPRGYVEVVADKNKVAEVRMMTDWGGDDRAQYERSLLLLGKLLVALGVPLDKVMPTALGIRKPLLSCRYGSSLVESGGIQSYATSWNDVGGSFLWIVPSDAQF